MNSYSTFKSRFFSGLIDSLIFFPAFPLYYYLNLSDKGVFISYHIIYILLYITYTTYFHGKHGQTIGKKVMKITVLSSNENSLLGYKKAFLRDSVWLLIYLAGCIYVLFISRNSETLNEQHIADFDLLFGILAGSWVLFEIICLWATSKRRAVHDFIAGSVVVKLEMGLSPT